MFVNTTSDNVTFFGLIISTNVISNRLDLEILRSSQGL